MRRIGSSSGWTVRIACRNVKRLLPIIALAALIGACSSETADPAAAPSTVTSTAVETVTVSPSTTPVEYQPHPRYLRTCTELAAYDGLGGSISRGASEAEVQDYLTRSREGDEWLTDPVEIDAYDQAVRDYAAGKCP